MKEDGCRIWFDEGITPASDYDDVIESKIKDCDLFIAFFSKSFNDSVYCIDELKHAWRKKRRILIVYLDDTPLPGGLELHLDRNQAIYINKHSTQEFYDLLYATKGIEKCKSAEVSDIGEVIPVAPVIERHEPEFRHHISIGEGLICGFPSLKGIVLRVVAAFIAGVLLVGLNIMFLNHNSGPLGYNDGTRWIEAYECNYMESTIISWFCNTKDESGNITWQPYPLPNLEDGAEKVIAISNYFMFAVGFFIVLIFLLIGHNEDYETKSARIMRYIAYILNVGWGLYSWIYISFIEYMLSNCIFAERAITIGDKLMLAIIYVLIPIALLIYAIITRCYSARHK